MSAQSYQEFLQGKMVRALMSGFEISDNELPSVLKGHQTQICKWALRGGRRAIFAAFGLGKSFIQLSIMNAILNRFGGKLIIVAPLGVRQEFFKDAAKLGIKITFIKSDIEAKKDGIYLTNYEPVRDGKIDTAQFIAATLDEASVLRSYGSKTYQTFLDIFKNVRFRYVATATPSPNRYKEIIHYSAFLGIMDSGQALTRFFQRDSEKANNLTLYPHKEAEFWLWVSSWAVFLQKPSDLGFSDDGYDLPPIEVRWHEIQTNSLSGGFERDGQGVLIKDAALGLPGQAKERRETLIKRVEKTVEIINAEPENHFVIWHDLEDERHAIQKAVSDAVSVYGTQDLEDRERCIREFSEGKNRILSTKPSVAGSGTNIQPFCHRAIYFGIGHKFNDFIQSIHRLQRFQQQYPVIIDLIYTEQEHQIRRSLEAKWSQHNEMVAKMSDIIREYGLNQDALALSVKRSMGVARQEARGENWHVANNDCVEECALIEDNSVDLIVTSVPFCYDDKTEVLTRDGWRSFDKINTMNCQLATVSQAGKIEYQLPSSVIWEPYEGEMIKFVGRSFNLLVTPNHRMYVARRGVNFGPDKFDFVTADEITSEYENAEPKM